MMKNKYYLILLAFPLMFSSCANHFKYFGNSYAPTQNAKIFFREADIDKPYEVMGKMYCDFKVNMKDVNVQKKIMNKVKANGGDGAIFGDMTEKVVGSVTTSAGASKKIGGKRGLRVGGNVSKSSTKDKDKMEIIVIKYK